jgi:protein CpxP
MRGSIAARVGLGIVSVLLAGTALAQGPDGGPMGGRPGGGMDGRRPPIERAFGGHGNEGRWWNNPRIAERLKLTDDQKKGFDQILMEHREKLIDLRANLEKAELVMEPLVRDDQPNEAAILAQIDKVAQARAELEKANARYLLALRSKLTPEQWKQMREFRENREQMRGGHEGWGPGARRQSGPRPGGAGPNGGGPNATPPPPGPQGMIDDAPDSPAPAGAGAIQ